MIESGRPDRGALYGRRKGKPLRAGQSARLETLFPKLKLDLSQPAPADVAALFSGRVEAVRIEIGFGGGEHLVAEAQRYPDLGFIGVEPFLNGMAKALVAIDELGLTNIRLYDNDAAHVLDWLPLASLVRADLLYPDPWPKKRQWKRRFVSDANLARLTRVIRPGGEFRFASDIDTYVDWTLQHTRRSRDLSWTAERADDWRLPWPNWQSTRYEQKAIREGRIPAYLIFARA